MPGQHRDCLFFKFLTCRGIPSVNERLISALWWNKKYEVILYQHIQKNIASRPQTWSIVICMFDHWKQASLQASMWSWNSIYIQAYIHLSVCLCIWQLTSKLVANTSFIVNTNHNPNPFLPAKHISTCLFKLPLTQIPTFKYPFNYNRILPSAHINAVLNLFLKRANYTFA